MKKLTIFFTMAIASIVLTSAEVHAQQRRERGNERNTVSREQRKDRSYETHRYNNKWNEWDRHDSHTRRSQAHYHRPVRYVRHNHSRYCEHRPVIIHHYHKPRYIYYRDYDVYYDYHRKVYISYSGRSWTMATEIPIGMRHLNLHQTKRFSVNYYDDDFVGYLETGRPEYDKEWID